MCSVFTHSLLGLAIARIGTGAPMPARYWVAAALIAAAPDLDASGYALGLGGPGASVWSHRGLTHSLLFASLAAAAVTLALFSPRGGAQRPFRPPCPIPRWQVWLILWTAMASHGLTDMLTNGGSGIALFSPLTQWRTKWAFHPVEVSPLGVSRFFTSRGLEILWSELRWVLLPAGMAVAAAEILRRRVLPRPA